MTRFEKRLIGPDEAKELLEHNYAENRNVRRNWVNALAGMMADGQFVSQNGETIIVDESGTLYNGQHRMHAVVKSGVTLTFDVAVIPDDIADAAYKTMDNVTKRKAADFVSGTNSNLRAAIASVACCTEYGSIGLASCLRNYIDANTSPSRIMVADYANEHAELIGKCATCAKRMRDVIGCGAPSAYGIAMFLAIRYGHGLLVEEFVADVCDEFTANQTARAFVTSMRKNHMKDRKPTKTWVVCTMLDAYRHYEAMDNGTAFNKQRHELAKYDKLIAKAREGRDDE